MIGKVEVRRLAVLAYHKIGGPPPDGWDTWYYIPEAIFIEQMEFIRHSNWSVIDLSIFLSGLDRPEIAPDRSLLLTFDDGYRSMRTIAQPILQQFGFPAVCFMPTDYIGANATIDGGAEPAEPMCDWEDLHALSRHGVAIQSHGVSHYWLSLMDHDRLKREFIQSKQVLEEGLGEPVEVFAFPYSDSGGNDDAVNGLLRESGYRAAFLCGGGPSTNALPVSDPYRVDRLAMYRDTDFRAALAFGET